MKNELSKGNASFKHGHTTMALFERIEAAGSFEELVDSFDSDELMDGKGLLTCYLNHLLNNYNRHDDEVCIAIGYDQSYLGKIKKGKTKNPRRDFFLALCVEIGATVEETEALLKYAELQPLYARRRRDAIILYALMNNQSLHTLDTNLISKGYDPLGTH